MISHAERVLAGIIDRDNPRRDLLGIAVLRLADEHFVHDIPKNIFKFLVKYYDRTGQVIPQEVLVKALEDYGIEASKVLAYSKTYEALADTPIDEAGFKWSVDELRAEQAKRLTGVAITEAMEILERGYDDPKTRAHYEGHADAREYLTNKLHAIDRLSQIDVTPEGEVFKETDTIFDKYLERRDGTIGKGILSGIAAIDDHTGGFQRGELSLICAYAGVGKSQVATQAAWSCAVEQGKNAYFATTETLRDQVIRRILARHSYMPQFDKPIDSADLKKGTLDKAGEKVLADVLEDWHYNSTYGKINVVQMPALAKLSYAENRMRDWAREVEVHFCVLDYLALFSAERTRNSEREEFNEIIRGAKGIAQGSFDGWGVPVVSPWQINRDSYDFALRNGYYTKASLSDTSEAEKSSDQIIALLRDEDNNRDMRLQFLKMRDDDIPPLTTVAIDFRHTYVGAHLAAPTAITPGARNTDDLMNLL